MLFNHHIRSIFRSSGHYVPSSSKQCTRISLLCPGMYVQRRSDFTSGRLTSFSTLIPRVWRTSICKISCWLWYVPCICRVVSNTVDWSTRIHPYLFKSLRCRFTQYVTQGAMTAPVIGNTFHLLWTCRCALRLAIVLSPRARKQSSYE